MVSMLATLRHHFGRERGTRRSDALTKPRSHCHLLRFGTIGPDNGADVKVSNTENCTEKRVAVDPSDLGHPNKLVLVNRITTFDN